jgi:hypothetical protein
VVKEPPLLRRRLLGVGRHRQQDREVAADHLLSLGSIGIYVSLLQLSICVDVVEALFRAPKWNLVVLIRIFDGSVTFSKRFVVLVLELGKLGDYANVGAPGLFPLQGSTSVILETSPSQVLAVSHRWQAGCGSSLSPPLRLQHHKVCSSASSSLPFFILHISF